MVHSVDTNVSSPPVPFERWDDDPSLIENGFGKLLYIAGKSGSSGIGYHIYEFNDPDNDLSNIQRVKSLPVIATSHSDHHSVRVIDHYLVITRGSYIIGIPEIL